MCFDNTRTVRRRPCYDNTGAPGRLPYAPLQLCYCKNTSLTFYTHPVLGGCQNNSTIGTSPDPEDLACETRPSRPSRPLPTAMSSVIITRPMPYILSWCYKKHLVNILHPPCSGLVSEQLYYRHFTRPSLRA